MFQELYRLRELVERGDFQSLQVFSEKPAHLLKTYHFVGGMPEAVAAYVESGNLNDAREVQNDILFGYERGISKMTQAGIVHAHPE